MRLRVSVIVPVWNGERHLGEALESILAQDHAPDEVILVDDGSTDGTPGVARAFAPRVTYVRQEHAGAPAARNRGVTLASAPIHAHVDADDLLPQGSLRVRIAALLADPRLEAASGHVQNFHSPELTDEQRARLRCPPDPVPSRVIASLVIRDEAFRRVGSFETSPEPTFNGEMRWFMRAQERGLRVAVLPDVVLRRRLHASNWSHANVKARDQLAVLKEALDRRRGGSSS